MEYDGTRFSEISEMTGFLHYFRGLPDHCQPGKVDYQLPEVLLLILLAVLAGRRRSPTSRGLASRRSNYCDGFGPSERHALA
jgi:hypothetical protein